MSAVLQPITTRAITPPVYDNTRMDFRHWYERNEPRLIDYWNELNQWCPEAQLEDDFFSFAVIQHERAAVQSVNQRGLT